MEIYLAQQTVSFLLAIVMGAAMGLLYDAFRISRIAIPTAAGIVAAEDIIFFSVCAVATFLFLLGSADGKVRFFLLVGELIGAVLYFCTLSVLIMGFSRAIISFLRWLAGLVFRLLILPVWKLFYLLVSLLLRPLRFFEKIIKKVWQKIRFSLKKWRILLYNQSNHILNRILKQREAKSRGNPDETQTG